MPASLARRHRDPIEVEVVDGAPTAFRRRGRRYTVRAVLAHWWETAAWWELAPAQPGLGVADDEREVFRVEAAVSGLPVAVVELTLSWTTGRWFLSAVGD